MINNYKITAALSDKGNYVHCLDWFGRFASQTEKSVCAFIHLVLRYKTTGTLQLYIYRLCTIKIDSFGPLWNVSWQFWLVPCSDTSVGSNIARGQFAKVAVDKAFKCIFYCHFFFPHKYYGSKISLPVGMIMIWEIAALKSSTLHVRLSHDSSQAKLIGEPSIYVMVKLLAYMVNF